MSEAHQIVGPAEPIIHDHFVDVEQQTDACTLGMWLFLAQEIMFFGGLFTAYAVYRLKTPEAWAEASHLLDRGLGALNTTLLLLSSLTMALCVYATQRSKLKQQVLYLCATLILGGLFLFVKFYFEWPAKFHGGEVPGTLWHPHPGAFTSAVMRDRAQMFFVCYFIMTGMHALHIIIGIGVGIWLLVNSLKKTYGENRYLPIEFFGFYWHFVDVVWVFLFPLFYLVT